MKDTAEVQSVPSSPAGQGESGEVGLADGLPAGWAGVTLGDVAAHSKVKAEPAEVGDRKYVGLEHIEGGTNRVIGYGDVSTVKSTKSVFVKGDVLYGKLRPYLNKVCRPEVDGVCSTDILVFPGQEHLDNGYLLKFLSQKSTADFATQNANGINLPRISAKALGEIDFPLAPKAEQVRIVSAIESLQERSARAKQSLCEVGPLLSQLRQSVLRGAFSGRLTERWRTENPNVEPASELLARIRTERRECWEAAQLAKYEAKGKQPPKNWQDKYKEPEPVDKSELEELPDGWCWVRGEQLFDWASGKNLPQKKMRDGEVPVYGGNGCSGHHDEANVFEQTVCIGRVGAHCGNVHLTPKTTWITDNAIFATFRIPSVELDFAVYAFRSLDLNERSRGGGQPYVNQDVLNDAVFALPPVAEQKTIVDLLNTTRAFVDRQLRVLASSEAELTQLDQSILAKAFRGELVPQDPSDEPASQLLHRIRTTRAQLEAEKKAAKKKSKKKATRKKNSKV